MERDPREVKRGGVGEEKAGRSSLTGARAGFDFTKYFYRFLSITISS
jgi:hypothetical protein